MLSRSDGHSPKAILERARRRSGIASALAFLALAGVLPFHEHAARLGELESLQDRTLFTAAVHPNAPHHAEATTYALERSCPACLSTLQASGARTQPTDSLPAPALASLKFASTTFVASERARTSASARGPPSA
ncbi:MAG: hypothetical protein ABI609_14665 [Acidobacteriota bacterium]